MPRICRGYIPRPSVDAWSCGQSWTLHTPSCGTYDKVEFLDLAPKRSATIANRLILTIYCNERCECGLSREVSYCPLFSLLSCDNVRGHNTYMRSWRRWVTEGLSYSVWLPLTFWQPVRRRVICFQTVAKKEPQIWGDDPKGPNVSKEPQF